VGRQFFEAFGNVVITQPSGTIIYADRLHYDAAPQIATLTNNVRMVDNNSVLTTNHRIYKMRDKIGNYTGGGRIISRRIRLPPATPIILRAPKMLIFAIK